jgi:hypothetical protein
LDLIVKILKYNEVLHLFILKQVNSKIKKNKNIFFELEKKIYKLLCDIFEKNLSYLIDNFFNFKYSKYRVVIKKLPLQRLASGNFVKG